MEKCVTVQEAIEHFFWNEYQESEEVHIPEDGVISLGYTTWDFDDDGTDESSIQVCFDMNRLRYLNYINDELVLEENPIAIEEFIHDMLWCDFNDIIANCVEAGRKRNFYNA